MAIYRHLVSGETVSSSGSGYDDPLVWELLSAEATIPDDGRIYDWTNEGLAPRPRRLSYDEVVALYTPTEVTRIFAAPQLQVTQLLIAVRYFGVIVGSVEHSQGTALIAGLGLLDAPERAARILAGLPPE